MDFTYYVAAVLSLVIGFVGAIIFVATRGRSYWQLLVTALAIALIADFALLLDWSHADQMTAGWLLTDLAFFAVYGVVGCSVGALPVLAVRRVIRSFQQRHAE
jgi:hypothetical protein